MNELSEFQRFVLSQIVPKMDEAPNFQLYQLIRDAIIHKDVSSFPEELVVETYEAIDAYLIENAFLNEQKERRCYILTEKGRQAFRDRNMDSINGLPM